MNMTHPEPAYRCLACEFIEVVAFATLEECSKCGAPSPVPIAIVPRDLSDRQAMALGHALGTLLANSDIGMALDRVCVAFGVNPP